MASSTAIPDEPPSSSPLLPPPSSTNHSIVPAPSNASGHAPVSCQSTLEPLYLSNPYAHLVDALPYIDPLSTELEQSVKSLIDEEMQKIFTERGNSIPDYLSILRLPETLHLDDEQSITNHELRRLQTGRAMEKLDTSHYTLLEAPTGQALNDVNEWKKSVETAHSLLEHSTTSLMNLELMIRHCKESWLGQTGQLELIKQKMEKNLKAANDETEQVNKQRKLEQMEFGNELRNLLRERSEYVERNNSIIMALRELRSDVMHLKNLCEKRDVLPTKYLDGLAMDEELFSVADL